MLRDIAVQRVQDGMGFRRTLADTIVLRFQEEQRDLERGKTLPSFLIRENQTLSLLIGTNSVNLPADFLRRTTKKLRFTPQNTTISTTIPWRDYDAAYEVYQDATPGGPQVAILRQTAIIFLPTANVTYPITWDYYRKDALLTANIENLWLATAPELLIGGAGLRISKDIGYQSGVTLFGDMYKQARQTWYGETIVQDAEDGPLRLGANA